MSEAILIRPLPTTLSYGASKTEAREYGGWAVAAMVVIGLRAIIFLTGLLSLVTAKASHESRLLIDPDNATGIPWLAFDGGLYREIILHGYPTSPTGEIPYHIAYFPLYPLTCRLLTPIMPAATAMIVLANACTIVGFAFFFAWARTLVSPRTALMALILMSVYPGSVFFCAALTEGPFFMFVCIVLYLLRYNRIYPAAIVSGLATSLRPTAVALAFVVVLWTLTRGWETTPRGRLFARVFLIGCISFAGAVSYEAFLWKTYGRYDAYKLSEDKWDHSGVGTSDAAPARFDVAKAAADASASSGGVAAAHPASHPAVAHPQPRRYSLQFFIEKATTTQAWNRLIALVLFTAMLVAFLKPIGVPRILLLLPLVIFLMAYLPNAGLRASSIFRYESAGVPVFMVAAIWLAQPRRRHVFWGIVGFCFLVQMYYAVLFSRGQWVG